METPTTTPLTADLLRETLATVGVAQTCRLFQLTPRQLEAYRGIFGIPRWWSYPLQRQIIHVLQKEGPLRVSAIRRHCQPPWPHRQALWEACQRLCAHGLLERTIDAEQVTRYQLVATPSTRLDEETS